MPKTILTERLTLRIPHLEYAPFLFDRWVQDPDVTRFMTWTPHQSMTETQDYIATTLEQWQQGHCYTWFLMLKEERSPIGGISMKPDGFKAEISYALAQPYWGQGLMTEAASRLVKWLLEQPQFHRVSAVCDVENYASQRLLEKLSMTCEGTLRRWLLYPALGNIPRDCFSYSRVKS